MDMKRATYAAVATMLLATAALAQSAGGSGMSFLKIPGDARSAALGGNGATLAEGAAAIFHNPAAFAEESNTELLVTGDRWIQDVSRRAFAARFSVFGVPLGVGVNSTSVDGVEVREKPGPAQSTIEANYFAASVGAGFHVAENISAGVAVKYLYEGLLADEATGWAADIGARYRIDENLDVSFAARNLGAMNELREKATELPMEIRFGPAYRYALEESRIDLAAAVEYQKWLAADDHHVNASLEATYDETFALRLGYRSMYESHGLAAGFGVAYGGVAIDYAAIPFAYDLGLAHSFALRVGW
ncbi:MAG: PorV/PorQ family protein [Ignavibacteriales bacterium]|nr:PorV/PorQ family protein [Ignavibacteriales bacterium]